jgi:hypothetical protein
MLYPHAAGFVEARATELTYSAAKDKWTFQDRFPKTVDEYMVAVTSATLIGAYTIPKHYIKQLTQWLSVMYVAISRTRCPDQIIQEYLAATGLEMGSMGELMINTLGPLLAITSDTTFDVNGQVREFVATSDLRDR